MVIQICVMSDFSDCLSVTILASFLNSDEWIVANFFMRDYVVSMFVVY
jgi:hypothetical protein